MSCRHCNCNPCKCESSCDPANESLRSMLLNFLIKQLGQPEQVCVNGEVVWVLPCGLDAGSVDFAKETDESIDCYFLRWLEHLEASIGQPAFLLANNLSEGDLATKLANLGLGSEIQAWSAQLDAWSAISNPSSTVVGISDTQEISNKTLVNPSAKTQTLTDQASIAWNAALGEFGIVTLGGNRTMAAPSNLKPGTYVLKVIQDGVGSRTLAYNAVFKWAAGVAPVLSTGIGAVDILTFVCDGTNLYGVAQLNFS